MERFKYFNRYQINPFEIHIHIWNLIILNKWPPTFYFFQGLVPTVCTYRLFRTVLPTLFTVQNVLGEWSSLLTEIRLSVLPTFSSWKTSHCVKHYGYKYEAATVPDLKQLTKQQGKIPLFIVLVPCTCKVSQAAWKPHLPINLYVPGGQKSLGLILQDSPCVNNL